MTQDEQDMYKSSIDELTSKLIELIQVKKEKARQDYLKVMTGTNVKQNKRALKKLDYIEKGIGKIISGGEMVVFAETIIISNDEL